jgi:serine protease AprX
MRTSTWSRRTAALVGCALVALAATGGGSSAGADTLGTDRTATTDTLVADTATTLSVAARSGWLYDDAATSMEDVRRAIGADVMWKRGYTGEGVGIALLDTGVVPVAGLTSGNVLNGPDLSFESLAPQYRYLDTFGHGTHMAGIIAGRDTTSPGGRTTFSGVAPDARLTSLKLATSDGAVDVSQVVAAVDWVVEHRNDDPQNPIRVLNLSYGTDGVQDYRVDPLTHAVENAWRAGIVVVASGGNDGSARPKLNNPAYDPRIIAVGAADLGGTPKLSLDDTVPAFSSRGDASRRVDVTAPGRSIVSLRNPGSNADTLFPAARVGDRFFKGSGTSEAAAVVSGGVALLLQQRPGLTPDQVKALLRASASPMPRADAAGQGAGEIDVLAASATPVRRGTGSSAAPSRGTGSLEAARGTQHVADGDTELAGEQTILGPWDAAAWAAASSAGTSWVDGSWNGQPWTGSCWCATSWAGRSWDAVTWAGASWAGRSWDGRSWDGRSWDGRSWDGRSWDGRSWDGRSWDGRSWDGWGAVTAGTPCRRR